MALTAMQLADAIEYAFAGRAVSEIDRLAFATRELPTCRALVDRYCPQAPETVRESACVRIAGALAEGRFGAF